MVVRDAWGAELVRSFSFIFSSTLSKRVWRTKKATKAASWTTSPPRSERTSCGTGAMLTVRIPGRGVFCLCEASYSAFFLYPLSHSRSVPLGRRAAPSLFARCGGASRPEPSRSTTARVWPRSGVVAPAAFERRQRVRAPWHDRWSSSVQFTRACDLRKTAGGGGGSGGSSSS